MLPLGTRECAEDRPSLAIMSSLTEHRKLAAIMFTDMVAYSALAQRNESLALELLGEQQRLLRNQFALHNGREVKSTGDGFLVVFPSALAAVQCAVEIQTSMAARNAAQPIERQIRVRIGIHVGDVVEGGDDIHGDGVNIAARIEPLAEPGGICITRAVFEQIENKVPLLVVPLNKPELKNIQATVQVYKLLLEQTKSSAPIPAQAGVVKRARLALALAVTFFVVLNPVLFLKFGIHSSSSSLQKGGATNRKAIAILPFRNLSSDKEYEYFAESLTEQLLSKLLRIEGLRVVQVSDTNYLMRELAEISREFKVGSILKGSASKAEEQLRIHVELVEPVTYQVLWAEDFEKEFKHIFSIQDEVAQSVAEKLRGRLSPVEQAQLSKNPTRDLEAFDLYLRGRAQWNRFSNDGLQRAIRFYEQAITKDTNFALAYSGLSDCYTILAVDLEPPAAMFPKAQFHAERALALDSSMPQPHVSAGMTWLFFQLEWAQAEQEFKRALAIRENYADAHHYYAHYLEAKGQFGEAQRHWSRAAELDPTSLQIAQESGLSRYLAEDFQNALVLTEKAVKKDPSFIYAKATLAAIYSQIGRASDAIEVATAARKLPDGNIPTLIAELGYAHARAGQLNEAKAILNELAERKASGVYVDPWCLAIVHVGLN